MKIFVLLAVAFLPLFARSAPEAVVTLTSNNFDQFLSDNKAALIEFYAPWCGHCKSLAPEYEKAAQKLQDRVPLAKVDATVERALAERFEVRGYPTLKFFRGGKPEEYTGGRTEQTIIDWVDANTGPAVTTVSESELETLKQQKPTIFALYAEKDSEFYAVYDKFADTNRDLGKFVHVKDSSNKLTAFRKNEDPVTYEGAADLTDMGKWINDEALPLFGPINGDNYSRYQSRSADLTWVVASPEDGQKLAASIREVAKKFRSTNSFVHLDTNQFASHAENSLGVSEYPAVVIQRKSGRFVYPEKEITTPRLASFIEEVNAGKVKRSLKSEPVPESNDGPVKVVVGNNFQDIVIQKDKSVFLEVYAPWCGHCKKLEPTWNELGESLVRSKEVVIAKMDGTANESPVEGFEWSGFPSLFFIKAGTTQPVKYNGGRSKDDLVNFLKAQGVNTTPLPSDTADEL